MSGRLYGIALKISLSHPALPLPQPLLTMTYPRYRPAVSSSHWQENVSVTQVIVDGNAVGLCVALMDTQTNRAEILSIFVRPAFRGRGAGSDLLRETCADLFRRGCAAVEIIFTDEKQQWAARVRAMLASQGWQEPQRRMLVVRFDMSGHDPVPSWMKAYKLRGKLSAGLWKDVSLEEKAEIVESDRLAPWIAPDLRPAAYEEGFSPLNSLVLRYDGKIVGWMINHQVASHTMRFTCSFVREDLQRTGCIIALYNLALRLQMEAGIMNLTWVVPYHHPRMVEFCKRRLTLPHGMFFDSFKSCVAR